MKQGYLSKMRSLRVAMAVLIAVLAIFAQGATAETRYVSALGSNTPPFDTWEKASHTIQAAIDSCVSGDTILVGSGTYSPASGETFPIHMSGVPIIGLNGAPETIVDAQGTGDVLQAEDVQVCLSGLTVTGGSGNGIYTTRSGVSITNCRIIDNYGVGVFGKLSGVSICYSILSGNGTGVNWEGYVRISGSSLSGNAGWALYGTIGDVSMDSCLISGNGSGVAGGEAIGITDSEISGNGPPLFSFTYTWGGLRLSRSRIIDNQSSIYIGMDHTLGVDSCVVAGNAGDGITVYGADASTIVGSTICDNTGSGITYHVTSLSVTGTIISRNAGLAVNADGVGSFCPYLTCCDVFGNKGGDWVGCIASQYGTRDNFCSDPLFCSPDNGDYRVSSNSPCVNPPGCGQIGALGVGCSPPAVEVTTWGRIKSMFR